MAGRMTHAQFDALSELLRLREGSTAKAVATEVLVGGVSVADAARHCGTSYNAAHQAIRRCERGVELSKIIASSF